MAYESIVSYAHMLHCMQKPDVDGSGNCVGMVCQRNKEPLKAWRFQRRERQPDDVEIQITYCGMCHSDIHQMRDEWGNTVYPCVPGHEVLGVVTATSIDSRHN
jgi:alcohol dehydrogenase (NADP+)